MDGSGTRGIAKIFAQQGTTFTVHAAVQDTPTATLDQGIDIIVGTRVETGAGVAVGGLTGLLTQANASPANGAITVTLSAPDPGTYPVFAAMRYSITGSCYGTPSARADSGQVEGQVATLTVT